jgi:SAM-dependent methyltransferase
LSSPLAVDARNRQFYDRFSYPWPAGSFSVLADRTFGPCFLNQELGAWRGERVPPSARIWVAGCGTNQAVLTALAFPDADVLGTDLSVRSLSICERSAQQLGVRNLRLEEASLNACDAEDAFDYVICTGVVHHNADPAGCLVRLARALARDGVLELMVYNAQHRQQTAAYQEAIRTLVPGGDDAVETQLTVTRELIADFAHESSMGELLRRLRHAPEAMIADALLQPVEHSCTVRSLGALLHGAGLEYVLPRVNEFDRIADRLTWELRLDAGEAGRRFVELPDAERWHVASLLLGERSPMLWFYVQRRDSSIPRHSAADVCETFLATRFARYSTEVEQRMRSEDGTYAAAARRTPLPSPRVPRDDRSRALVDAADGTRTMRELFHALAIEPDFATVNALRVGLTTPLFPYLRAAGSSAERRRS